MPGARVSLRTLNNHYPIVRKFVSLLLLTGLVWCDDLPSYVSPGLQIGLNSKFKLFVSAQITYALSPKGEWTDLMNAPPWPGLTIGFKSIIKENGESGFYSYVDIQVSKVYFGSGFGMLFGNDISPTPRAKIWGGPFLLGSYEFINFENELDSKHYFGIFGVYPYIMGENGGFVLSRNFQL